MVQTRVAHRRLFGGADRLDHSPFFGDVCWEFLSKMYTMGLDVEGHERLPLRDRESFEGESETKQGEDAPSSLFHAFIRKVWRAKEAASQG
ncbi:uncharacterized protein G2W53_025674 [Senna tora]|uniref:Uncharacterized protein n=1 Tax=Senna tora TaxID=362788 RepID=A0A834WKH7_9FABA|nr:uncharacterized protein G2W53_025674 [Senna tora]